MKGSFNQHSVSWLKNANVVCNQITDDSIQAKSEWICGILAGIPAPVIVMEETEQGYVVMTQQSKVSTLIEFLKDEFKIAPNSSLSFLNKAFSDIVKEDLEDMQICVYTFRALHDEERKFVQSLFI